MALPRALVSLGRAALRRPPLAPSSALLPSLAALARPSPASRQSDASSRSSAFALLGSALAAGAAALGVAQCEAVQGGDDRKLLSAVRRGQRAAVRQVRPLLYRIT